ncbi:putative secreted protein [Granulibacter bethesdensis CGDNIH1]|uniref:Secreted protein n=2 Tax=Granulibacter bethesdensis TaxID=364410 RepID=Q0BQN7_GRABC|nr:putative secreted protein [Granulibacter bethesdensis CGDNIH1]APH52733.1 putative secreted protein [Granulibacter bethesdensis]APH65421.1 putative secreted protein [Granulibacter bethesdensis]
MDDMMASGLKWTAMAGVLASFMAGGACLAAETAPLVIPSKNVQVLYDTVDPDGSRHQAMVTVLASAGKLRIETPNSKDYIIIDRKAGNGVMVIDGQKSVMPLPPGAAQSMTFEPPKNARFNKTGTEVIAGQPCTVYDVTEPNAQGSIVCLTADGVLLNAHERAQNGASLTAVKVSYSNITPAYFDVPQEYRMMRQPGQ